MGLRHAVGCLLLLLLLCSDENVGAQELVLSDLLALLAIKQAFSDPRGALQSWNESGYGACQDLWAGVKCGKGQVTVVQLAGLGLGGKLSEQVGQLGNLRKLNLHSNNIQGPIPASLASLPFLRAVYLHENKFSGEIPQGLGSSSVLQRLYVSSNQLSGQLPVGLAASKRLLYVNVSHNLLSGPLPPEWAGNPSVQVLAAAGNLMSGGLPQEWSTQQLQVLDLGGNRLNGSIPQQLGSLVSITYLDLGNNELSGNIPTSLADLVKLTYLDLSRNRLTGSIPAFLFTLLPNLAYFSVAYNAFSGPIPDSANFPSAAFAGNPGLCGKDTSNPCSREKGNKLSAGAWAGVAVAIAVAVTCICMLVIWRRGRKGGLGGLGLGLLNPGKRPQDSPGSDADVGGKLVHFDGPLAFSVDDLLRATAEVLGKSSYGTVYKATLEDGNSVAVKRLKEGIVKGQREFEGEIQSLGATRHPNLLALRAYFWGPKAEKLLVYDFMPLGSLAAFLHGSQNPLPWLTRLRIAIGTARGLAFLHSSHKMVHANLTSSNILLDRQMTPQISDYGLARVMTASANSTVIATAGALGYGAPELAKLKKATFKSDVYSFGVILLELLTGKAPSEGMAGSSSLHAPETSLPEWVASVVKEEWTNEVFDVNLMKETPPEDDLLATLQLALNCVVATPSSRPDMEDVLMQLEQLASPSQKALPQEP